MNHGLNNKFLYAVSRIAATWTDSKGNGINSQGTGFFIQKGLDLFFITNRHVLQPWWKEPKYVDYTNLTALSIDSRKYEEENHAVSIDELQVQQFGCSYPDNGIDDIVCLSKIRLKRGYKFLSVPIDFSLLATREQYEHELCVGDMVSLIGFPNVYDHKNNMPVLRNGVISSDPRLDYSFDGQEHGHVLAYEAFSTQGISGSPVFALQKGFRVGGILSAPEGFYRPLLLVGINASNINQGGIHQHMSLLFKSDQIIALIERSQVAFDQDYIIK